MRVARMFLVLAALAAPNLARAEEAPVVDVNLNDRRCLLVAMTLAAHADEAMRQAGMASALYFLGRIDGRATELDLEGALYAEAVRMTEDDVRREGPRCGAELTARGADLQEMSRRLAERAQREQQTQRP